MISLQSERLLAFLKGMPFFAGYGFSIYNPGLTETPDGINQVLCGSQEMSQLCRGLCVPFLTAVSNEALTGEKAVLLRCPRSRFIFAVPLSADSCLVCGGALSVDTDKMAQETILAVKRLIATFISREETQPLASAQPAIGSHNFLEGQRPIRQCRR